MPLPRNFLDLRWRGVVLAISAVAALVVPSRARLPDTARLDSPRADSCLSVLGDSTPQTVSNRSTPRILVLDPLASGEDSAHAQEFARWLTTALRKDGRAIPYRPTQAIGGNPHLATTCGDSVCAREWLQAMKLEQVWFGRMGSSKDSIQLHLQAWSANDSRIAPAEFRRAGGWEDRKTQANLARDAVETLLAGVPSNRTIELDLRLVRDKPRILVLDPVVPIGGALVGRDLAGRIATELRRDGRTIPFRPTSGPQSDTSLHASCGTAECARKWFKAMPLEEVWFGSEALDADTMRVRFQVLDARDSANDPVESWEAASVRDRRWPSMLSEAVAERLVSKFPVKRTLLLDGTADKTMVSEAFAQRIARNEEEYRNRLKAGWMVTGIGAGTVVFGFGTLVLTTLPCGLNEIQLAGGGGEDDPDGGRERARQKEEQGKADVKACEERSPGKPIMAVGGLVLVCGLLTMISSATLSEEIRVLKKQARISGVSVAPYLHPHSGSPGVLAQVVF